MANGRGGAVPAEVLERLARDTDRAADEGSWPPDPLAATSAEEVGASGRRPTSSRPSASASPSAAAPRSARCAAS